MSTQMNATMKLTSYKAFTSLVKYMTAKRAEIAEWESLRATAQTDLEAAVKAFGYPSVFGCLDFDKVLACMTRRLKGDLVLSDIAAFRKILREFDKVVSATVKYKEAAMPRVSDKPKKVSKTQRKKEIYQKLDYLKQQADTGEIDLKTYMQAQSELLEELREL